MSENEMTFEERAALWKVLNYLTAEAKDYATRQEVGEDVRNHIWESMVVLIDYLNLIEWGLKKPATIPAECHDAKIKAQRFFAIERLSLMIVVVVWLWFFAELMTSAVKLYCGK
jgi:hypothetical protein